MASAFTGKAINNGYIVIALRTQIWTKRKPQRRGNLKMTILYQSMLKVTSLAAPRHGQNLRLTGKRQ